MAFTHTYLDVIKVIQINNFLLYKNSQTLAKTNIIL